MCVRLRFVSRKMAGSKFISAVLLQQLDFRSELVVRRIFQHYAAMPDTADLKR
jgi:hypothetical protein